MPRSRRLLLLAISLWGVYFLRAHQILALPVFVDESLHILRAQVVFDFSDAAASFLPGKLLLYYYLGLFGPDNQSGLWVARMALALLAPLCAALCYALVQVLTRSFWMGIVVIWLYASAPLLIFFERMVLADTLAMTFALGLVWAGVLMARRPTHTRPIAAGLLLGIAFLAKLTALPLVAVPMLAMRLFGHGSRRGLVTVYGMALLTILPSTGYAMYQEVRPPEKKAEVVTTSLFIPEDRSRLGQVEHNIEQFASALWSNGLSILVLVMAVLGMRWQPRATLYLLATVALAWGFLVAVSAFPSTRYLMLTFPLLLVLIAVVLHRFEGPTTIIIAGLSLALLGINLLPSGFIARAWNDPARLKLSQQDEWEYFRHTSSGYALREAAGDIFRMDDAPLIVGFVGSCHSLRLYGSNAHDYLLCPLFPFDDNPALATFEVWLQQFRARGEGFAVVEEVGAADFIAFDFNAELLGTYARPHDGESLTLYRITP